MSRRRPDGQLSLFGPEQVPASRRVQPADVSDAYRAAGDALPERIRLGTSSWSFPGWAGLVYDREAKPAHLARHGLAAYAEHPLLGAVGIDRTYYAPISSDAFAEYAAAVPAEFRFLVKAASLCTDPHVRDERGRPTEPNPTFLDVEFTANEVVAPLIEGLGRKAGALVFQFPPLGREVTDRPEAFAERLTVFLASMSDEVPIVVELRDRELVGPAYREALTVSGARHCYAAHPRMPSIAEQRRIADAGQAGPLVARWMLHAGLGYAAARERYEPFDRIVDEDVDTRRALADLCADAYADGRQVIVTANNKAEGSAPETIFRLAGLIIELIR